MLISSSSNDLLAVFVLPSRSLGELLCHFIPYVLRGLGIEIINAQALRWAAIA
jgi:hypothetical protein